MLFWATTPKRLEQIQGVTAGIYLEVKRTLREYRSNP